MTKKENKIKFHEDLVFHDTKTFNIYKLINEEYLSGSISSFSFDSFYHNEELAPNQKILTAEVVTIDDFTFKNYDSSLAEFRNDLKFYFFLNNYFKKGLIKSFELLKYNATANRKYNAKRTIIDGFNFASRKEACYYIYLLIEQKNGRIESFKLQPKFILLPAFKKINPVTGREKSFQALSYVADFEIVHNNGYLEIVDVKGVLTEVFEMKRKIFEAKFPELYLTVIKQKKEISLDFIDIDDYNDAAKKRKKAKKLAEKNK